MKRSLMIFLKAGVSLGLLAFFLTREFDFSHFFEVISAARFSYIGAALLIYLAGQVISSLRWALLAGTLGFRNPFKDFATFYFIGMFFSLFTPTTVGGDVGRVFYLARDGANTRESARSGSVALATISVLADRAIGMAVLVWIGAVAVAAFPGYALPASIRYATFALAVGLLAGGLSLPLFSPLLRGWQHPMVKNLSLALQNYPRHWRAIVYAASLSLAVHFLQTWIHVLLGRALEADIPWSYAFIIYPLVGTFSALPVSLNGIGLREGGYLLMLSYIGIGSEKAIAFGLVWFIVVALDSLIGGLLFILRKSPAPAALAAEAKVRSESESGGWRGRGR
ncbi:MAG TPA: lysylphosphatidylglycerol synthase transmembrane domain-containing protein [Candidatus Binatia bacterium]